MYVPFEMPKSEGAIIKFQISRENNFSLFNYLSEYSMKSNVCSHAGNSKFL